MNQKIKWLNQKITLMLTAAMLLTMLNPMFPAKASDEVKYIINGDMEQGAWGADNCVPVTETNPLYVHSGLKSMKISGNSGYVVSNVSVDSKNLDFANKNYYLTMWAKADSFDGHAYFQAYPICHKDENTGWYGEVALIGSGAMYSSGGVQNVQLSNTGWIRYAQPIKLRAGITAGFAIRFFVRGSGTVWIDDIEITEVPDTLVKNGGMELGAWGGDNCVPQIETRPDYVHSGVYSMKMEAADDGYAAATVSQNVGDLDFANKSYCLSVWAKADSFDGYAYFQAPPVWHADEFNGWYGEIAVIGAGSRFRSDEMEAVQLNSTGWVRYCEPIRLRDVVSGDFNMRLFVRGTGAIWIDDIDIIEMPYQAGDNLLSNGGFESGIWASEGSNGAAASASTDAHEGLRSLRLDGTSNLRSEVYSYQGMSAFDSNKRYSLSLWMKTENVAAEGARVMALQYDETNGAKWFKSFNAELIFTASGTTQWTKYTAELTDFPDTVTNLWLYVRLHGGGTVWYDDVRITEVTYDGVINTDQVVSLLESGSYPAMTTTDLLTDSASKDIYYTVDGSDPNTSAARIRFERKYPIIITESFTLKACVGSANNDAPVYEYNYICSAPMIPNGSFEAGLWSGASSGFALDSSVPVGIGSSKSARVPLTAFSQQEMSTKPIRLDGRYDYTLSFWVRTSNRKAGIRLKTTGDIHNVYYEGRSVFMSSQTTQDWTKYTYDLKGVQYPDISIVCFAEGGFGTVYFDGFTLTAVQKKTLPIKFDVIPGAVGNIYTSDGQAISNGIQLTNLTNAAENYKITYTLKDDYENIFWQTSKIASFTAKGSVTETLDLSAAVSYGIYTVGISAEKSGVSYDLGSYDVSRVDTGRAESNQKLGVSVHLQNVPSANSLKELTVLKNMGAKWIRTDCVWAQLETVKGNYSQIGLQLDNTVNNAKSLGLNVLLVIAYDNPLYSDSTYALDGAEEMLAYKNFCTAVAAHFNGRVDAYEVWNEWNYGVGNSSSSAAQYTEVLKIAYPAIKAADSNAVVIGGVTVGADKNFVQYMMQNNAKNYMDAVSIHPYSQGTAPEAANTIASCESIYDMVASYGKEMPLWLTEIGWPTAQHLYGSTETEQMQYTTRMLALALKSNKISKVILYQGTDASGGDIRNTENYYGMFRSAPIQYAAKPVYAGLSGMTSLLDGCTYKADRNFGSNLKAFEFTDNRGNPVIAVWSLSGERKVTLNLSENDVRIFDIFGNPVSPNVQSSQARFLVDGAIKFICLGQNTSITQTSEAAASVALGDINLDNIVNASDIIVMKKHLLSVERLSGRMLNFADMDGGKRVSIEDMVSLKKYVCGYSF